MIKNIIFDFGGVLLDLDFDRTFEELSSLTGLDLDPTNLSDDLREVISPLKEER